MGEKNENSVLSEDECSLGIALSYRAGLKIVDFQNAKLTLLCINHVGSNMAIFDSSKQCSDSDTTEYIYYNVSSNSKFFHPFSQESSKDDSLVMVQ